MQKRTEMGTARTFNCVT